MNKPDARPIALDLVVSLLAVNNFSLEVAFELSDALVDEGLAELDKVKVMSEAEVARRLEAAGYRRGEFLVNLLASRLKHLAEALSGSELARLRKHERDHDTEASSRLLLGIHGIGPAVVRNFRCLRNPSKGN